MTSSSAAFLDLPLQAIRPIADDAATKISDTIQVPTSPVLDATSEAFRIKLLEHFKTARDRAISDLDTRTSS